MRCAVALFDSLCELGCARSGRRDRFDSGRRSTSDTIYGQKRKLRAALRFHWPLAQLTKRALGSLTVWTSPPNWMYLTRAPTEWDLVSQAAGTPSEFMPQKARRRSWRSGAKA